MRANERARENERETQGEAKTKNESIKPQNNSSGKMRCDLWRGKLENKIRKGKNNDYDDRRRAVRDLWRDIGQRGKYRRRGVISGEGGNVGGEE